MGIVVRSGVLTGGHHGQGWIDLTRVGAAEPLLHGLRVIAAQAQRTRLRQLEILVLMGTLQAFAPLSIDMYLPSLPLLERVFGVTTFELG